MSKTVAERIEVGLSDLGYVFIHEFQNQTDTRFEVRAGNHTVLTTDSRERALEVANTLAGKTSEAPAPIAVESSATEEPVQITETGIKRARKK